jgi:hypothetical protein
MDWLLIEWKWTNQELPPSQFPVLFYTRILGMLFVGMLDYDPQAELTDDEKLRTLIVTGPLPGDKGDIDGDHLPDLWTELPERPIELF